MKIGIDLGGSHIAIGVINNDGKIVEKVEKRLTLPEKQNIKKVIEDYIIYNVNKYMEQYEITEVGIAIPGTVNKESIVKSVNLGIEDYNIVQNLKEKINLPIKIRNDAKCAAIAENEYGCLKEYDRNLFLTLGTGIGGAVIINNELLGTGDLPGCEIGHMVIEKNGIPCNCGKKGCFERYASIKSLKQRITKTLNLDSSDISGQYMREHLMVEYHDQVQEDINDFLTYLRIGICNLIDIFEPEVICFGGSFSYYEGHPVLNKLIEEINKPEMTFNDGEKPKIVTALFKNDAGIIGATLDN